MRKAVKYIYSANPIYVHCRKHFCPKCGEKMNIQYIKKTVNSKSPEAKYYDFSVGDTFYFGNVEFRTGYFCCKQCQLDIAFQEMKNYERIGYKKNRET